VFDRPEWLSIAPAPDEEGEEWCARRYYVMTKLARLTVLVRKVRELPEDEGVARDAVGLAHELIGLDWNVSMGFCACRETNAE